MFITSGNKITVGRCRWWGLHKFGVPIKMIALSLERQAQLAVAWRRRRPALDVERETLADRSRLLTHMQKGPRDSEVLQECSCVFVSLLPANPFIDAQTDSLDTQGRPQRNPPATRSQQVSSPEPDEYPFTLRRHLRPRTSHGH